MDWSIDLKDYLLTERATGIVGIDPIEFEDGEALTTRALKFAIKAHEQQIRKNGTPYINHPIAVANLVREAGYGVDNIAAAYLHGVCENTNYTWEDIAKYFGQQIAYLVKYTTEEDKTKSWEERKENIIEKIQWQSTGHNIVLLCDKICNIEETIADVNACGIEFFEKFTRGPEKQRWYYARLYLAFEEIYKADYPLVQRFKSDVDEFRKTLERVNDGSVPLKRTITVPNSSKNLIIEDCK